MKLKILVIAPELPLPAVNGGRIRRAHFLSALAKKHDVTLVCPLRASVEDEALAETGKLCRRVITVADSWKPSRRRGFKRYLPDLGEATKDRIQYLMDCPELREKIASLTREERFDAALAEYWYMLPHFLACSRIRLKMVDLVDVESGRWFEAARFLPNLAEKVRALRIARFARAQERMNLPLADRFLVVSSKDAEWLSNLTQVRRRFAIAPVGVDVADFPFAPSGTPGSLLFVGSLMHAPNLDAVRWVVRDVLPEIVRKCPAAKLTIVGNKPPDWLKRMEGPHLETTGEVPSVVPYLKRAQVFLAPVRFRGGIRTKLLEPMAMGVPVVTTSASAEGLNATPGEHLAVGDTARELVDRTIELLTDEGRRTSIASSARRFVEEKFSWTGIGARLCETIERWHREMTREGTPP